MIWKILAAIVLVWVAFAMLGWVLDAILPLIVVAAVGAGLYYLFKSMGSNRNNIGV